MTNQQERMFCGIVLAFCLLMAGAMCIWVSLRLALYGETGAATMLLFPELGLAIGLLYVCMSLIRDALRQRKGTQACDVEEPTVGEKQ